MQPLSMQNSSVMKISRDYECIHACNGSRPLKHSMLDVCRSFFLCSQDLNTSVGFAEDEPLKKCVHISSLI